MQSLFSGFLNRHLDEINEYLASFFNDQTDNADIDA